MGGSTTISTSESRIEAIALQSSAYGVTVPVVFGVNRISGNMIWYGDFKATPHTTSQSSGGKGGGGVNQVSTTYTYSASVMMGLCEGEAIGINQIWKSKQLYAGGVTPAQVMTVSEPYTIPGGGGVFTVAHAANFGAKIYVSIHYNSGGGSHGFSPYNSYLSEGDDYTVVKGVYTFSANYGGSLVSVTYQYTVSGAAQTSLQQLKLSLATGSVGQATWPYLGSFVPKGGAAGDQAVAYSGITYVYAQDYDLGSNGSVDNHSFEVQGSQAYSISTTIPDANPATVTFDLLTNARYGAGFTKSGVYDLSAWSSYCLSSGMLLSPALEQQLQASDFITQICAVTNTAPVWSGGRLKFIPYGDTALTNNGAAYTPNVTPVYDLTDDDFTPSPGADPIKVTRKPQADAFNHYRVEFLNRANAYNIEIAEAKDSASIDAFGLRSADVLQCHWICDATVAQNVVQVMLQRNIYVRNTYEFNLSWAKALLEPMDLVTLTDSTLGFNKLPVRLTAVQENDGGDLSLTAEDFAIGIAHASLYPPQGGAGFQHNYGVAPGSVASPVIFEAPGQLTATGLEVWIAARGTSAYWGGCHVWISVDSINYKNVGTINGGTRYGNLTGPISGGLLPVSLTAGTPTPQLISGSTADATALNTLCYIGGASPEFVAYATASLTGSLAYNLGGLVRGAYGSNGSVGHTTGDAFVRCDDGIVKSGQMDKSYVGKTIYVKLTSFNIYRAAEESLASVSAFTYAITGANIANADVSAAAAAASAAATTASNASTTAGTAQAAAQAANTAAVAAQATANTAVTNAAAAQATANTAATNASSANTALANLASDNILSPSEKPSVVQDYATITNEQSGIDAQATTYAITTEKTTYDTAVTALTTYLGTLTGWNSIPGTDVAIVGTTFRQKFADVYAARQALLNAIIAKAKTLADAAQGQANTATTNAGVAQTAAATAATAAAAAALTSTWSGVSGTGKPVDNATANQSDATTNSAIGTAATTATWGGVSGAGKPSDNATATTKIINTGNITIAGNTATKTGSGNAWDGGCVSADSYTGGAYVSAITPSTGYHLMFGLNSDPITDNGYSSIDYAVYVNVGTITVYESGTQIGSYGSYSVGDVLAVTYDGVNVRYLKNGTVYRTVAATIIVPLFFDSSFYEVGSSLTNIQFGPMSNNSWSSIGGAGRPADNATANQSDATTNGAIATAATTANYSGLSGTPGAAIANSNISIGSNGALSGGGGGAVTIGGLGYTGAMNATANQSDATTNAGIASAATTANWGTVAGAPTTLAALNSTDGTKLSGIAAGATVGATWDGNIASQPSNDQLLNNSASGGVLNIPYPVGGKNSYTGSTTGALKIRLPQGMSNTMLRFTVRVYEYNPSMSCTYEVGGYAYSAPSWINVYAKMVGSPGASKNVWFGTDASGYACIWIGGAGSSWSYPTFQVVDFQAGYSNYSESQWASNWGVTIDATGPINVTNSIGSPTSGGAIGGLDSADASWLNANQTWAQVSGAGKPADNATVNQPDATTNSAISTAATTAVWSSVSGTGKPADGATVNQPDATTNSAIATAATTANYGNLSGTPNTIVANNFTEGGVSYVLRPVGAAYGGNITATGAMIITLPVFPGTNAQVRFRVHIYDINQQRLIVYRIAATLGGSSGTLSAVDIGVDTGDASKAMQISVDSTGAYGSRTFRIAIGTAATNWAYFSCRVLDFAASADDGGGDILARWGSGWSIAISATGVPNYLVIPAATVGKVSATTVTASSVTFGDATTQSTAGSRSLATNGYTKLPDGTILQWGKGTYTSNAVFNTVTFPLAFPTAVIGISVMCEVASANSPAINPSPAPSTTSFQHFTYASPNGFNFRWFAIGY